MLTVLAIVIISHVYTRMHSDARVFLSATGSERSSVGPISLRMSQAYKMLMQVGEPSSPFTATLDFVRSSEKGALNTIYIFIWGA